MASATVVRSGYIPITDVFLTIWCSSLLELPRRCLCTNRATSSAGDLPQCADTFRARCKCRNCRWKCTFVRERLLGRGESAAGSPLNLSKFKRRQTCDGKFVLE